MNEETEKSIRSNKNAYTVSLCFSVIPIALRLLFTNLTQPLNQYNLVVLMLRKAFTIHMYSQHHRNSSTQKNYRKK